MNNKVLLYILGGVLGLGLIVAVAVSAVSGGTDENAAFGEVTVEGSDLPTHGGNQAADVATGMPAPTVTGTDFDGSNVSIAADGRSKVVIFLAHWCPHCQAEVPRVVDWLEAGNQPESVDFYAVSTLVNRLQGNWPPAAWLAEENWTVPTIQDDQSSSVAAGYGMAGTPFWVVLDGDNNVVARIAGEVGDAGVAALFQTAADA